MKVASLHSFKIRRIADVKSWRGAQRCWGPKGPRHKTATGVIQVRVSPHEKQCIEDRVARRKMSVAEFIKDRTLMGRDTIAFTTMARTLEDALARNLEVFQNQDPPVSPGDSASVFLRLQRGTMEAWVEVLRGRRGLSNET